MGMLTRAAFLLGVAIGGPASPSHSVTEHICTAANRSGGSLMLFFGFLSAGEVFSFSLACVITPSGHMLQAQPVEIAVGDTSVRLPVQRWAVTERPGARGSIEVVAAVETTDGSTFVDRSFLRVNEAGQPVCILSAEELACPVDRQPADYASGFAVVIRPATLLRLRALCADNCAFLPATEGVPADGSWQAARPTDQQFEGESQGSYVYLALGALRNPKNWKKLDEGERVDFHAALRELRDRNAPVWMDDVALTAIATRAARALRERSLLTSRIGEACTKQQDIERCFP